MTTKTAAPHRVIERWPLAPGYAEMLDRADAFARLDMTRPGHAHDIVAVSTDGLIDFRDSESCVDLGSAFDAIQDESALTCRQCGEPGEARTTEMGPLILCDADAATGLPALR